MAAAFLPRFHEAVLHREEMIGSQALLINCLGTGVREGTFSGWPWLSSETPNPTINLLYKDEPLGTLGESLKKK
jgi:hypothetical protein